MHNVVSAFRNFIESTVDYFEGMSRSIACPYRRDKERASIILQAYSHNKDDVRFMLMALEWRESIAKGFFNRHADAVAEFLKCGATPWESIDLLDDCIVEWATTPMRWEDVVARKCRELVLL